MTPVLEGKSNRVCMCVDYWSDQGVIAVTSMVLASATGLRRESKLDILKVQTAAIEVSKYRHWCWCTGILVCGISIGRVLVLEKGCNGMEWNGWTGWTK